MRYHSFKKILLQLPNVLKVLVFAFTFNTHFLNEKKKTSVFSYKARKL